MLKKAKKGIIEKFKRLLWCWHQTSCPCKHVDWVNCPAIQPIPQEGDTIEKCSHVAKGITHVQVTVSDKKYPLIDLRTTRKRKTPKPSSKFFKPQSAMLNACGSKEQNPKKMKTEIARHVETNLMFAKGRYFIVINSKAVKPLAKGTIIDIETDGLFPNRNHIITLGILKRNEIRILQLIKPQYTRFQKLCHRIVETQPKPHYAYASHFEQSFLQVTTEWQDLTQYYDIEYDDECPVRPHRLASLTFHPFPNQPYDIDGQQVLTEWQQWLKTKKPKHLSEIIYHNTCDILRTQQILEKNGVSQRC